MSSIIPGITPPPFPPSVVLLSVIVVGHLSSASGCEPSGHVVDGGVGRHDGSLGVLLQSTPVGPGQQQDARDVSEAL